MIDPLEGRFFQTFIAVLEEKSFSRAADKLGYVQSTITTHIQLLEKICGQRLFHRLPREVKPTEAGITFSKYAYQYIYLSNCILENMDALDQPHGTVRVKMQESFFLTRMLPFMQRYIKECPEVKLRVEAGFYQDILDGVLDFAVDFGIVPQNPDRHDILFYPLIEENIVFTASPKLAQEVKDLGVQVLNGEISISGGTSCLYHTKASEVLKKSGVQVKDALELASLEMIKQIVSCGRSFALLPEIAIKKELKLGKLKVLPFIPKMNFTHGLIVHKDRELTFTAKCFQSQLIDFFSNEEKT